MALVILAAPFFVGHALAREPAPVIEASGEVAGSKTSDLEQRLTRLERLLENQTLVDIVTRLDSLQNEVQQLVGQVEEQTHNMELLKKRQRDLYLDIDRRLQEAEKARASLSATPGGSVFGNAMPTPAATGAGTMPASSMNMPASGMATSSMPATTDAMSDTDPQQERVAYERAFNLLKESHYDLAIAAFKIFMQTFPKGRFADNAQYWLGEANYVQRHFAVALSEFDKVVKNYPTSPKRADALLKMGYTYQELGQADKAQASLNEVVTNYPNTTAASLAQKRLQDLKQHQ